MNWKHRHKTGTTRKTDLRRIGTIAKPHGLHGDFFLYLESDLSDWLLQLKTLFVEIEGEILPWQVLGWKKSKDRLVVRLKELPDRTAVEEHFGMVLFVKEEDAQKARGEDFFFNSDLMGMRVYPFDQKPTPSPQIVGKVIAIHELPAYNQIEIRSESGATFLLPFVKALVPEIDLEKKIIWANIPEGLESLE